MSVMGEAAPSSVARFTRNRWPSEDTAYCCLYVPGRGPPAMRTGNRTAGVLVSSEAILGRMVYGGRDYHGQIVSVRVSFGNRMGRRNDRKGGLARRQDVCEETGDSEARSTRSAKVMRAVLSCRRR